MNDEKIYVGSGKMKTFDNGGHVITCAVSLTSIIPGITISQIAPEMQQYAYFSDKTQNVYLNLKVSQKKEVDQYGKSHSVTVDTFKPEKQEKQGGAIPTPAAPAATFQDTCLF